jgi:AraC family transcriptional regulator
MASSQYRVSSLSEIQSSRLITPSRKPPSLLIRIKVIVVSNSIELPENIATLKNYGRCWNGFQVEINEFNCTGHVLFPMESHQSDTRLGGLLEEVGRDHAETRAAANTPCPVEYRPRHMYFAPADMELWGHSDDTSYVKCASISFDIQVIHERLGLTHGMVLADVPKLRFYDDRIWTLIKLLADAIQDPDPTAQLYGDSLSAAIAARLFEPPKEPKGSDCRLSPVQLKDAINYLYAKLPARVELAELAELAGLSQSHFSRAFKGSTGVAPYQWQLQARVERAKDLLLNGCGSLEHVAEATGFADAVHFGRTFRKITGATPAAWRKDLLT